VTGAEGDEVMPSPAEPRAGIVSPPSRDLGALPAPVAAIRAKILEACAKRELEALRIPIDWNETRPMFQRSGTKRPPGYDPIEALRALSYDRRGFETLNVARACLSQAYAKIQRGPVTIYEWPAFAGPPKTLDEERAFWSCVRFSDYARPLPDGRPRVTKLGFGEDGVWHYFWSEG
jgi:hypothetical protein